jgi:hypothetical protein
LRPRGARLENACANCKRMYGSNSNHTDRRYWAADSMTASFTSARVTKSQIVAAPAHRPAHAHPSPQPSALSCVRQFRLSCRTLLPPDVEPAERAREDIHTVTCYHPSRRDGWRDTDWFKTHVPDQTLTRPRFIQGCHDLCRSTPLDRTRSDSI